MIVAGTREETERKVSQVLQELYQVDDRRIVDVKARFQKKVRPLGLVALLWQGFIDKTVSKTR